MKKILFLITILCSINSFSQEIKFKEYSYTEFFELLEAEKDSIFTLKNAIINPNKSQDFLHQFTTKSSTWENTNYEFNRKDTIHIYKEIALDNVHFMDEGYNNSSGIYNMVFHEKVVIKNTIKASFISCTFHKKLELSHNKDVVKSSDLNNGKHNSKFRFDSSIFFDGVDLRSNAFNDGEHKKIGVQMVFENSKFYNTSQSWQHSSFFVINILQLGIEKSTFYDEGTIAINSNKNIVFWLRNNVFERQKIDIKITEIDDSFTNEISGNVFNELVIAGIDNNPEKLVFEWEQLKDGIIDGWSYQYFYASETSNTGNNDDYNANQYLNSHIKTYKNNYRIKNKRAYRAEIKMLGGFYDNYKSAHDIESANTVYTEMKDLETKHLKFLYTQNPTFDTFFTLKINQFLKAFSGYGTRPSKAITFSIYVILFFALIYLFFPNSWDKHGRKRIMDRYTFFLKYMNKKAGMHEVYLDEQKEELLEFNEFKTLVEKQGKTVPRFFTTTALPLYKWAISGTKFSASILSRVDIMKGTWSDLPKSKRMWKSVLLITFFSIAIVYDIFIKMLNALMLSINTFTTLGFGEIPIKGLPRYLAIIQGFIGWFMLTIFSVSLISQLLN